MCFVLDHFLSINWRMKLIVVLVIAFSALVYSGMDLNSTDIKISQLNSKNLCTFYSQWFEMLHVWQCSLCRQWLWGRVVWRLRPREGDGLWRRCQLLLQEILQIWWREIQWPFLCKRIWLDGKCQYWSPAGFVINPRPLDLVCIISILCNVSESRAEYCAAHGNGCHKDHDQHFCCCDSEL